ncbi:MAG: hypothetical protein U5Q03_00130 [Bacteroidota bacterium]|nr:hypothetical protein [Bacteroidota bacterium]
MSGNTLHAKIYSDGYRYAPHLPKFPEISICPKCESFFWLNNESEIKKSDIPSEELDYVPFADFLSFAEYVFALKASMR